MNIKGKSTLENLRKILNLRNYSENTINTYIYYVGEFINSFDKPALHITAKDIKEYIENYNYSSISKQNQIYSSIKLFAKHILNIKNLGNIILERPRKEKRLPRIIDKDVLKSKILLIPNKKHRALLCLAYSCGLRVSEVVNLKIKDIDSGRMLININQAKGRKDRVVPLSEPLLLILREYFKKYKPVEYLFNGKSKTSLRYSTGSCNKIVKKYISEDSHFHLLRHSALTHMLENGTDVSVIQSIAGHRRLSTTSIYLHVSNNLLQQVQMPI